MPSSHQNSRNDELTEEQVLQDICAFFRQSNSDASFSKLERQRLLLYPGLCLRIAFAGQTNAGKSTLLNAMLDEQLLTSSTLQCSTEIVSVGYGERYESRIQFADGATPCTETHENAKQLAKAIQEHISVPDSYRNIPYTLIDHDILSGEADLIADGYIQRLEQRSGLVLADEVAAIKSYIASRNKSDIPLCISITSPGFPYRDLTFLDSPGFNAVGGFHEKNTELFAQADTVVLVHSLVSPIEHFQLHNLVERALESHKPRDVFLVLTQACRLSSLEKQSIIGEAKRIYGSLIASENILAVDSLAFLTMNALRRANGSKNLMRGYKKAIDALELIGCPTRKNEVHELKSRLNLLRDFTEEGADADISKDLLNASGMGRLSSLLRRIDASAKLVTDHEIKRSLADNARRLGNAGLLTRYEDAEVKKCVELVGLMSKDEEARVSLLVRSKNDVDQLRFYLDDSKAEFEATIESTLFTRLKYLKNQLAANIVQCQVSIAKTQAAIDQCKNSVVPACVASEAYRKMLEKAIEICSERHREATLFAASIPDVVLNRRCIQVIEMCGLAFAISVVFANAFLSILVVTTSLIVLYSIAVAAIRHRINLWRDLLKRSIHRKKVTPTTFPSFVDQKNILQRINEYS